MSAGDNRAGTSKSAKDSGLGDAGLTGTRRTLTFWSPIARHRSNLACASGRPVVTARATASPMGSHFGV